MTEPTRYAKVRTWTRPDIVNVGGIVDVTEVGINGVRDNTNDQLRTYHNAVSVEETEVDLEG